MRTVEPNGPLPTMHRPTKLATGGIAARIITYFVKRSWTVICSASMARHSIFGSVANPFTRSTMFMRCSLRSPEPRVYLRECTSVAQHHQVVAVDELRLRDISQRGLDLGGRLAQDARRLGCAVIHQAACDFATVGTRDAYHFAALEGAFDGGGADGEQALAVGDERLHRARVESDAPR